MEKFNTGDRVIVTYTGKKGVITKVYDYHCEVWMNGTTNQYVYNKQVLKHDTKDSSSMFINLSVSLLVGFMTFVIFAIQDSDLVGMLAGLAMYVTSFMVLKKQR
jgi:hypothetical protein